MAGFSSTLCGEIRPDYFLQGILLRIPLVENSTLTVRGEFAINVEEAERPPDLRKYTPQ
jgi:hypothetical protein